MRIHQCEPVGNGDGGRDLQPGAGLGQIADGAVDADRAACKDDLPALEHPLARATALAVHALKRKLERSVPTQLPTKKERRDGGTHRSQCMPGEGGPGFWDEPGGGFVL